MFSDMKHLRNASQSFGPAGASASTGAVSAKIPPGFDGTGRTAPPAPSACASRGLPAAAALFARGPLPPPLPAGRAPPPLSPSVRGSLPAHLFGAFALLGRGGGRSSSPASALASRRSRGLSPVAAAPGRWVGCRYERGSGGCGRRSGGRCSGVTSPPTHRLERR